MEELEKSRTQITLDNKRVEITEKLNKDLDEARVLISCLEDSIKHERNEKESKLRELETIAKELNVRDGQLDLAASQWADASVKLARLETEVAAAKAEAQLRAGEAQTQKIEVENQNSKIATLESEIANRSERLESFESRLAIAHAESKCWKEQFEAQESRSQEQQKTFKDGLQEKDTELFELQDLLCAFKHQITNLEIELINQEKKINDDNLKDIKILDLEIELSKLRILTGKFPERTAATTGPESHIAYDSQHAYEEENAIGDSKLTMKIVSTKSQESIVEQNAAIDTSTQKDGTKSIVIKPKFASSTGQPPTNQVNQSQESTNPKPKASPKLKKQNKKKSDDSKEKVKEEKDKERKTKESADPKPEVSPTPKTKNQKAKDTKGEAEEGKPKKIDIEALISMAREAKVKEMKSQEKKLQAWRCQQFRLRQAEAKQAEAKYIEEKQAEIEGSMSNRAELGEAKPGKTKSKEMNSQETQPTETLRRSKRLTTQKKTSYPFIPKHLQKRHYTEEEYERIADEVKKHKEKAHFKFEFQKADVSKIEPTDRMDTKSDHIPESQDSQLSFVPATQYGDATGTQISHISTTAGLSQESRFQEENFGMMTKKVHFADDNEQAEISSSSPQQILLYNAAEQRTPRVLGRLKHLLDEEQDDYDMDGDEKRDNGKSFPKRVRTHEPGDLRRKTWWRKKTRNAKSKPTLKKL
ncbi:hypothetical protein TWF694_010621 [Orbilia ellipsospora]|uniref:Uncharacterized protein n=1 Tax=Orbilia ellipsospora TaxID=2528407 RepID=A0AAV9XBQ2_9PEZI